MKLQRFYIKEMHNKYGEISLAKELWLREPDVINQVLKVFRAKIGYQLILFNDQEERLYKIVDIDGKEAIKLELITELKRKLPKREVYLLFSILKKDKNDWVLQKGTELGVHKFVPVIAKRSEKLDLNIERADKIIKEAAEQCGRGDVPAIREPISLHEALEEYKDMPIYVCEESPKDNQLADYEEKLALLIGPEGGWADIEQDDFSKRELKQLNLSDFTLRAETAAVVAASLVFDK